MDYDYNAIRNAILSKHQVIAIYSGHRREMCPHIVGTSKGRPRAVFYQFGGSSSKGLAPDGSPDNWRCMDIDKLTIVSVREGEWHTAKNYDPHTQDCVDKIDVYVPVISETITP